MHSIDLQCPLGSDSTESDLRRFRHEGQNANVQTDPLRTYYMRVIQGAGKFSQSILAAAEKNSTVVYVGGGRSAPKFDDMLQRQKNVGVLNLDFDREAFQPRALLDLNNIPDAFFRMQGTLPERLGRIKTEIASALHPAINGLIAKIEAQPVSIAVFSHVSTYLTDAKRDQLFRLFADPAVGAKIVVAEKTLWQYAVHPGNYGNKRGDRELQQIASERPDLAIHKQFLVPIIPGEIFRKKKPGKSEDIAQLVREKKVKVEARAYDHAYDQKAGSAQRDNSIVAWGTAEVITWLRKKER